MSVNITGLDKLQKTLEDANEAFAFLEGTIAKISFNPNDTSSVEAAKAEIEHVINTKLAPYKGNAVVENIANKLKKKYKEQIDNKVIISQTENA